MASATGSHCGIWPPDAQKLDSPDMDVKGTIPSYFQTHITRNKYT